MPQSNILQFAAEDESTPAGTDSKVEKPNPQSKQLERLVLGLIPFTPVQFQGQDSLIAWGRLAGYSFLSYLTFNKMRPVSYALMTAAGISLATSLLSKSWEKKQ